MSLLLCSMHKLTFGSLCNSVMCHWKAQFVFWSFAGSIWQCEVFQWGENLSLCIIHMPQPMLSLNWCHMMCHLAGTHALDFITSHIFNTPIFLSKCTNSNISCRNSWNQLWLGPLKDFQVAFMFISLCSVSFTLEQLLLKPWMFCCIACILFPWCD